MRRRVIMLGVLVLVLVVALSGSGVPSASAQEYTVNLKDTEIQEFIQFVADVTGTTIVVDPSVKGKVKVISSKPVSRSELYDLFLSILDVHGYTAVRSGNVIRIIQNKDARSSPVEVLEDGDELNNDEYVTQVIRLENVSAAKLIPVLRPLVPQQAHMAAYAPSNAIIIPISGPTLIGSLRSSTVWTSRLFVPRRSSSCGTRSPRTWFKCFRPWRRRTRERELRLMKR